MKIRLVSFFITMKMLKQSLDIIFIKKANTILHMQNRVKKTG